MNGNENDNFEQTTQDSNNNAYFGVPRAHPLIKWATKWMWFLMAQVCFAALALVAVCGDVAEGTLTWTMLLRDYVGLGLAICLAFVWSAALTGAKIQAVHFFLHHWMYKKVVHNWRFWLSLSALLIFVAADVANALPAALFVVHDNIPNFIHTLTAHVWHSGQFGNRLFTELLSGVVMFAVTLFDSLFVLWMVGELPVAPVTVVERHMEELKRKAAQQEVKEVKPV